MKVAVTWLLLVQTIMYYRNVLAPSDKKEVTLVEAGAVIPERIWLVMDT